jgi:glycosyltransferase involved in cell wall biosynthesis
LSECPIRVLHCPTNTGSHPVGLARAEQSLGLESVTASFSARPIVSGVDVSVSLSDFPPIAELQRLCFFAANYRRFDVFHFNYGRSMFYYPRALGFLDFWDLPFLKRAGKKIVVTYQGCDARQKDYCTEHFDVSMCAEPGCYGGLCTPGEERRRRRRVKRMLKYADHVFALNPDLLHVLPGAEFMPYASVDPSEWQPAPPRPHDRLKVLHAPTNPEAKGTRHVRAAMERITKEMPSVDYVEIRDVPYEQMKPLYEAADLVIDQLLAGWYGGLAVEAMSLGKPVVCYIRNGDLGFIPAEMASDLPVICARPDNLYEVLRESLSNVPRLSDTGLKSRKFAEKWHDPIKLAERAKEVYESLID